MVLDKFDTNNDIFIFKNNGNQEGQSKRFEISRSDPNAPKELYFVQIEIKDMDNLPSQEERKATMEAKIKDRKAKIKALREAEYKKRKESFFNPLRTQIVYFGTVLLDSILFTFSQPIKIKLYTHLGLSLVDHLPL